MTPTAIFLGATAMTTGAGADTVERPSESEAPGMKAEPMSEGTRSMLRETDEGKSESAPKDVELGTCKGAIISFLRAFATRACGFFCEWFCHGAVLVRSESGLVWWQCSVPPCSCSRSSRTPIASSPQRPHAARCAATSSPSSGPSSSRRSCRARSTCSSPPRPRCALGARNPIRTPRHPRLHPLCTPFAPSAGLRTFHPPPCTLHALRAAQVLESSVAVGVLAVLGGVLIHLACGSMYTWGNLISYVPPHLKYAAMSTP